MPTTRHPPRGETGLVFDVLGGADFRDGPPGNTPFPGATVGASALVGSGAGIALAELGSIGGLENISGHWGLNPANAVPNQGSHALSSVGDLFNGAATLGTVQLFSGTISSVEPIPPDGSLFGILDLNSIPNGGFPSGNLAYVQDEITANLLYTGILTGLDNVEPLYGTMGLPIPEPASAALMGFGLLGLVAAARRVRPGNR